MKHSISDGNGEPRRATRRDDVGRLAGVSTATVSRVYNRPETVSAEKREAVLAAADKLGYQPNREASALRRMDGAQILVLELKRAAANYWTDIRAYSWFFADAIRAIVTTLHGSLYYMTLDTWHVEENLEDIVSKHRPAGIICFDVETIGEAESIRALGLPYVLSWHVATFNGFNRVISDNYRGGYLAGECLRNAGCARPVYVTGRSYNSEVHHSRMQGFCDAMASAEVSIADAGLGKEAGFRCGRELADKVRNGDIDGLGVVNDITALGVAQGLMEAGIRIPDDVSLVGYDNMPVNIALPFRLTTVDIGIDKLYTKATNALLGLLKGDEHVELYHPPRLLPGDSVAFPE